MKKSYKTEYPFAINELIQIEMKRQDVSATQLAKKLDISMNSMYHILNTPSMQISRLWSICEELQINFFKILADQINIENPVDERMAKLESENETLKEVIKMLGGK